MTRRRGQPTRQVSRAAPPLSWFRFHPFLMFAGYGLLGVL